MIVDAFVREFGPLALMTCAAGGILVTMLVLALYLRENAEAKRRESQWKRRWR